MKVFVQFFCLLQAVKNDAFQVIPDLLFLQGLFGQREEVFGAGHDLLLSGKIELLLFKIQVKQRVRVLLSVVLAVLHPGVIGMAGPYHLLCCLWSQNQ